MRRVLIFGFLTLFLVLGAFVVLMLINPWILMKPDGDMYGNSAARTYTGNGAAGECREGTGDWWECQIELDPGSGFGEVLILWAEGRNCWTAQVYSRREPKRPIDPGDREIPPNVYLRGEPFTGCVSLRKDWAQPGLSPVR